MVYVVFEVFFLVENGIMMVNYFFRVDVWSFVMICLEIFIGCIFFYCVFERKDFYEKIKDGLRFDLLDNLFDCLCFCIESCWNLDF